MPTNWPTIDDVPPKKFRVIIEYDTLWFPTTTKEDVKEYLEKYFIPEIQCNGNVDIIVEEVTSGDS